MQVDGFPPKEVVKTVFVEHDIQSDLSDLNLVDYVKALCPDNSIEEIKQKLDEFGFKTDPRLGHFLRLGASGVGLWA